ncbi:MAG TPA: lysyl oxidase family protein [Anaerolineales bacterium]|nr:lysyl oxidase family protein [Anaerolineales bacterium]
MLNRISLAILSLLLLTASTPNDEIDELVTAGVVPPAARQGEHRLNPANPAEPVLILPDLRTLPPVDLQLQLFPGSGIRRLRFANTIWNSGPGDLDVHATAFALPNTVRVRQYIPTMEGDPILQEAGIFDFHEAHGHWHWEGFGLYEVLSVAETGRLGDIVAASDKIGYCLIDVDPHPDLDEEQVSDPFYTSCAWRRQGISSGWTDTYEAHIGGQYVDISDLPDGLYALRSTVDPDNIIIEFDETNNSSLVYFYLYGDNLIVMGARYVQPLPPPGHEE